jgi:hypothetical protein
MCSPYFAMESVMNMGKRYVGSVLAPRCGYRDADTIGGGGDGFFAAFARRRARQLCQTPAAAAAPQSAATS